MRAALSSSGHIISLDDTGANSFQREIVDRAVSERCGSFLFDRVKKLGFANFEREARRYVGGLCCRPRIRGAGDEFLLQASQRQHPLWLVIGGTAIVLSLTVLLLMRLALPQ